MTRTIRLSLLLCLVLAATAGAQAPMVENGDRPAEGRMVRPLVEEWRLGGEDDEENFFGIIGEVFADEAGNAYLVDRQLSEVQVYSPQGEWLHTLGRRGDGPGEIRNLGTALLMPDGSLGLVQGFPGRVVTVQLDGVPGTTMIPGRDDPTDGGFMGLSTARFRGGTLAFSGTRVQRRENSALRTNYVAAFTPEGGLRADLVTRTIETVRRAPRVVEADEDFAHQRWTVGPDGLVYVAAERNVYRIDVYGPDGVAVRSFGRSYQPLARTAVEKERAEDTLMPWRRRGRENIEFVVEDTEPDIQGLHVTGAGEVWVLTSRGVRDEADGALVTYDVFAGDGRFVRQEALVCDGDGRRDALFPLGDGRFVLVRGHADAVRTLFGMTGDDAEPAEESLLEIVSYRIGS